jgi:hypothetical protein
MAFTLHRSSVGKLPIGLLESLTKCNSSSVHVTRHALQRRNITIEQLDSKKDSMSTCHGHHGLRTLILLCSQTEGRDFGFRYFSRLPFVLSPANHLATGWAGFTVARRLDPKKYQAVVVSPRSYFVFTPLLASTSVGTLEFRTALEPVRSRRQQVEFFQGWADSVDFANKHITIEETVEDPRQSLAPTGNHDRSKEEKEKEKEKGKLFGLKYDKLVITVGCYSQTFGTPGVRENALFLKDVGDARKIRNRLLTCFETASLPTTSDQMRQHLLNFAIVGGGREYITNFTMIEQSIRGTKVRCQLQLRLHCLLR